MCPLHLNFLPPPSAPHLCRLSRSPPLGALCDTWNPHWLAILHVVMYMFQCYSLKSSHPLLPLSPKVCSLHLCLGRRSLNHWTTREVPGALFKRVWKSVLKRQRCVILLALKEEPVHIMICLWKEAASGSQEPQAHSCKELSSKGAWIRALSLSMRPQPQRQLVGPWTENPATLCLDSWSTDTVREQKAVLFGSEVCGDLLLSDSSLIPLISDNSLIPMKQSRQDRLPCDDEVSM